MRNPASLTGQYLAGKVGIPLPAQRREASWQRLTLSGAATHNLKRIGVEIPLGMLVCVTGVSGSGKSSLILDTLLPALEQRLAGRPLPGEGEGAGEGLPRIEELKGVEYLDKVIHVDQSPTNSIS